MGTSQNIGRAGHSLPIIGRMSESERVHETQVRVRYGEVDRMGVVYHANYLVYFEQGRTEYLRSLGGTYRRFEEEGHLLVVAETGVRHLKPAQYDDLLTVRTRLSEIRKVRMRFDYEVLLDAEPIASGFTVLACTDTRGRPRRLPEDFHHRVAPTAEATGGKNPPERAVQEASSHPGDGDR
jgi:acyl-CoA thioester hydrolase